MIFDSHAHYDDRRFNKDREQVIRELKENNVIGVLNCGASLKGARYSVKLAERHDMFYAAVGIHPSNANELTKEALEEIKNMAKKDKVRAIGEIGLDYYWKDNAPKEVQKSVFRKQMEVARELNLPVVIHDRDAHGDTLEILKEFPDVTGVIHCFSGSVEFARECIKLGYYIGITGVVTFNNAKILKEVVKAVPLDKLLVETDCPYMAPTPYRGERNRSDYIKYIIEEISDLKGVSVKEIEEVTIENTKSLLKISQ